MQHSIISRSGFDKEVVKYAVSVDADLIAIMNLNRSSFLNALSSNYEQYIITNGALTCTNCKSSLQRVPEYSIQLKF